jgi:hypothetical protein
VSSSGAPSRARNSPPAGQLAGPRAGSSTAAAAGAWLRQPVVRAARVGSQASKRGSPAGASWHRAWCTRGRRQCSALAQALSIRNSVRPSGAGTGRGCGSSQGRSPIAHRCPAAPITACPRQLQQPRQPAVRDFPGVPSAQLVPAAPWPRRPGAAAGAQAGGRGLRIVSSSAAAAQPLAAAQPPRTSPPPPATCSSQWGVAGQPGTFAPGPQSRQDGRLPPIQPLTLPALLPAATRL